MAKRGAGEGSITKRKDGKWQGAVTIGRNSDGTQKRKYVYGSTKNEVVKKLALIKNEVNTGSFIEKSTNPTISMWLKIWLWQYKKNSVRPTTFEQYETLSRVHIFPSIGDIKLVDLRPEHLQNLYNQMLESGSSPRTIQLVHIILRGALKQGMLSGQVSRNVSDAACIPKSEQTEMRVLTQQEQKAFIEVLKKDRMGIAYLFSLFTGLRRGELLALKWEDVNFEEKTVTISRTLNRVKNYDNEGSKTKLLFGAPKTNKSKRVLPLIDFVMELLRKHQQAQQEEKTLAGKLYKDDGVIFATALGHTIEPGNFNRLFYRLIKETGLPHANPHCLRHTFATRGLEMGIDMKTMQELLGHSSIVLTGNTYSHVLLDKKRAEMDKLNQLYDHR